MVMQAVHVHARAVIRGGRAKVDLLVIKVSLKSLDEAS